MKIARMIAWSLAIVLMALQGLVGAGPGTGLGGAP
jgi:hypothetical protein